MILALHDGKEEHATDFHCTQGATVQVQVLDARVRPEQLRNGPRPIVADGVACRRKGAGEKHIRTPLFSSTTLPSGTIWMRGMKCDHSEEAPVFRLLPHLTSVPKKSNYNFRKLY